MIANLEISSRPRSGHIPRMETITAEWLKSRLGDDRGRRAALAEALGIGGDKVSKMLAGTRKPQAEEIPKILEFFKDPSATIDPELARLWTKLTPQERGFLINAARAQVAARGRDS